MTARVFITTQLPEESVKNIPPEFEAEFFPYARAMTSDELSKALCTTSYDALICTYKDSLHADLLEKALPQLKVVGTLSAGVDHIDVEFCRHHGIQLYNAPNLTTDAVADYTVGLLLMGIRRLDQDIDIHAGQYNWHYLWNCKGQSLSEMTIGILGLGNIGQAIAQRVVAFGSHVIYTSRQRKEEAEKAFNLEYVSFDKLLVRSDALIAACSLNQSTKQLFTTENIACMQQGAIFINISRGEICDHLALHKALMDGRLGCALLDVTHPEPLPEHHPLCTNPNCLIFPHIATNVTDSRIKLADAVLHRVSTFLSMHSR